MSIEKYNRQYEGEKLLQIKEALVYSKELIPLALNSVSVYRFNVEIGNTTSDRLISVTAYDEQSKNSSITLYAFESKERKAEKVKLIKDMFKGKVELSDFTDMRLYQ